MTEMSAARYLVLALLVSGCGRFSTAPSPDDGQGGMGGTLADPATGGQAEEQGAGGQEPAGIGGTPAAGGSAGVGGHAPDPAGGAPNSSGGAGTGGAPDNCRAGKLKCDAYHAVGWLEVAWQEGCGNTGVPLLPGLETGDWAYEVGDIVCFYDDTFSAPVRVLEAGEPYEGAGWCNVSEIPGGFQCGSVDSVSECSTWLWHWNAGEVANPSAFEPQHC